MKNNRNRQRSPSSKPKTWEWLAKRLPLLNISELARRAGVPRHRIVDAQLERAKLSDTDMARLVKTIGTLR